MSSEEYCYTQMADTTIIISPANTCSNRSLAPNMLCMLLVIIIVVFIDRSLYMFAVNLNLSISMFV